MPSEIPHEYALLIKKSRGTKETCMVDIEMKYRSILYIIHWWHFQKAVHPPLFPSVDTVNVTLYAAYILCTLAETAQVQFVLCVIFFCAHSEFSRVIVNGCHLRIRGSSSPSASLWIALLVILQNNQRILWMGGKWIYMQIRGAFGEFNLSCNLGHIYLGISPTECSSNFYF